MATDRPPRAGEWPWRVILLLAVVAVAAFFVWGMALLPVEFGQPPSDFQSPADAEELEAVSPPPELVIEARVPAVAQEPPSGMQLYAQHCAACHGERGDGAGLVSGFLYPKARDFHNERFRLASTDNGVPTREDLHAVLERGMPGSSMPPWAHLSLEEREALVDEVLRLRREGLRQSFTELLKVEEDLTDEEVADDDDLQEEIDEYVVEMSTPGESTEVPAIGPPTPEAIVHGQELYVKFACAQCHGETGRGDGAQEMANDDKTPTRPRDLTRGIFKGNHDAESLYRRIAYGMPGTPMPSSSGMTPEQLVDLVHYIRSLSTDEQKEAAVLEREKIVAQLVETVPSSGHARDWSHVEPVRLKVTPLWWRDDADPNLRVQAVHDGRQLSLRITWDDATQDDAATGPDQFADMVAVQLAPAGNEPFLGMGSPDAIVELWQWRAGMANTGAEDELMDDYPFDTEVYRELLPAANLPDFLTARVAGNPLARREREGARLAARGAGSLSFLPPLSQHVEAAGEWNDGVWIVVLTRPLAVEAGGGLPLLSQGRYSIAFAVWDGAERDRAAQKLISIWNDLELE